LQWAKGVWYHPFVQRIDIALTTESVNPREIAGKLCVIIDVLRASTTIVTALANGCPAIYPAETPSEARAIALERGCLLGGERGGLRIEGFDFGNSPLEYLSDKIAGRPIAFTTTNGTRAMRACAAAQSLVVASFLNAGAVIGLLEEAEADILIVCAGTRGSPSIEDTACGGMLLDALHTEGSPDAVDAVSVWREHKSDLAEMMKHVSVHGRSLVDLGFAADIEFAARLNTHDIIAVREDDAIVRRTPWENE
jgi:2-phosphosulfolactate phosphatase